MTAKKVMVCDLMNGQWNRREGFEPSFVVSPSGERISRARILGTVVAKFLADDGNFASITLDDSTDTIRAKTFKTVKPLDVVEVGDIVDAIGKVKEYNAEIYIVPEVARKVDDPNTELLRRLEIAARLRVRGAEPTAGDQPEGQKGDVSEVRKELLKIMDSQREGISYSELVEKSGRPEQIVEAAVNELLAEGVCYEPSPGKIRKI